MSYSEKLKVDVINKFENGLSVETISSQFGIPVSIIYNWLSENKLTDLNKNDHKIEVSLTSLVNEINSLIDSNKLNEALTLCNKSKESNSICIQVQKVKILLLMFEENNNQELLNVALNICQKYNGNEFFDIQRKRIETLLSTYLDNEINPSVISISSKIKHLIRERRYEEALILCDDVKNRKIMTIQSQKVKILLFLFQENKSKGLLYKALNVCNRYSGNEVFDIQKSKIKLLLKEYFNEECDFNNKSIPSEIRSLINQKKFNEALILCNDPRNINDKTIQNQKVKILLLMFEENNNQELLNEALTICNRYNGFEIFDCQRNRIKKYMSTNKDSEVTNILTNIYFGTISKDIIEESNVNSWEKELLLISFYEKNNKKVGIKYLKNIKSKYQGNKEKTKILNLLYERLISKKYILFDISIYSNYLNCTINPDLIKNTKDEYTIKEVDVKNIQMLDVKVEHKEKKEIRSKIVGCTGNVRFNRYNSSNLKNGINKDLKESEKKEIKKIYIKDLFRKEVLEIGIYLYIQMNNDKNYKRAVEAWDKFDYLINKPSDDKEALSRMISLLRRIQPAGLFSNIEEKENIKILEKSNK